MAKSGEDALLAALTSRFVVVNLGAGGDTDYSLPASFKKTITLVTVDAWDSARYEHEYHAKHQIKTAIAGKAGRRKFRRNKYVGCSSLLEPREDLIKLYGLENFFEIASVDEVECSSLPTILEKFGLPPVDFLKTDLEGVDFEVIESLGEKLERVLFIDAELRFQPFFAGEPYYHEVALFLYARGFELVSLSPSYWKPKTAHRKSHPDGRIVWADCLFMKKPSEVQKLENGGTLAKAKQIIIASMLRKRGLGEYLFELYRSDLPEQWATDLHPLVLPQRPTLKETAFWRFLWYVKRTFFSRLDFSVLAPRS
jgi:FkbM family methyltransferase